MFNLLVKWFSNIISVLNPEKELHESCQYGWNMTLIILNIYSAHDWIMKFHGGCTQHLQTTGCLENWNQTIISWAS